MPQWKKDLRIGALALLGMLTCVLFWLWYGAACCANRPAQAGVSAVATVRPCVALTFDDGPRGSTTADLLEGLSQRGVHATFFLIGDSIDGNEELVQRMAGEGHQIGIHSQTHRKLIGLGAEDFALEVDTVRRTLTALLGEEDFMLRPPYGMTDAGVCARAGAAIILWAVDPEDWADHDSDALVRSITQEVEDGDIILLHDIYPASVDTALRVVDELMERGFYFVTVEELFALRGVEPEAGKIYRSLPPAGE